MEFALDCNGVRIYASKAERDREYFCPICHGKVILRKGDYNIDHFAHAAKCDDFWNYEMSEWHSEWQNQFPIGNREVVVENNGEKHRADAMACGYVIEFQHSSITAEEFDRRNKFYLDYGKKVIWVFDFRDEYKSKQMDCYDEWSRKNDNGGKYSWKFQRHCFRNFFPQKNSNIILFFQLSDGNHKDEEDCYLERVIWAIEEGEQSNFKRFITSYYPSNAKELLEWIKKRKL